jgi:hypothetical protein
MANGSAVVCRDGFICNGLDMDTTALEVNRGSRKALDSKLVASIQQNLFFRLINGFTDV